MNVTRQCPLNSLIQFCSDDWRWVRPGYLLSLIKVNKWFDMTSQVWVTSDATFKQITAWRRWHFYTFTWVYDKDAFLKKAAGRPSFKSLIFTDWRKGLLKCINTSTADVSNFSITLSKQSTFSNTLLLCFILLLIRKGREAIFLSSAYGNCMLCTQEHF